MINGRASTHTHTGNGQIDRARERDKQDFDRRTEVCALSVSLLLRSGTNTAADAAISTVEHLAPQLGAQVFCRLAKVAGHPKSMITSSSTLSPLSNRPISEVATECSTDLEL